MKARGLVAIALACAGVGTLVTNRPASAQIDPYRLSYGLYLVREGTTPVLAGEVYRDDTDPRSYTEHWVMFDNYVAPTADNGVVVELVPGLRFYADSATFLARVEFPVGAHYQEVKVATYDEVPATQCTTIQRGRAGTVADALINSAAGGKNYGASGSLTASLDASARRVALLRFDLGAIPATATVVTAQLDLNVLLYGDAPVRAHTMVAPWTEGQVTWASLVGARPAWDPAVVATFPAAAAGQPTSIDVTDLAQAWVSGATANDGLALERDAGATVFASSEVPTVAQHPALTICWF